MFVRGLCLELFCSNYSVRTPKLSNHGRVQYSGGGPPGKRTYCTVFIQLFFLTIHTLRSARSGASRTFPILHTSTLAKSLNPVQAQALTVAVLDPFRPLFSCPFRAGSGLPFLWVRFPHSPYTFSSPLPLPLHPIYIFISSPRPHISFPIDKSKCLYTLSSAACPIHKSPLFLFVYTSTAHFYTCFSSSFTYCDITHNPSSFPNNLQVLVVPFPGWG